MTTTPTTGQTTLRELSPHEIDGHEEARLNADSDDGSHGSQVPGKMFIGGLSWQTTAENLRDYFGRFGEVNECVVKRDPARKRSRRFGFITFIDPSNVDKVLNARDHELDGKKIDPKVAFPKRTQAKVGEVKENEQGTGGMMRMKRGHLNDNHHNDDHHYHQNEHDEYQSSMRQMSQMTTSTITHATTTDQQNEQVMYYEQSQQSSPVHHRNRNDYRSKNVRSRKVMIGGWPATSTVDQMIEYFNKFGAIEKAVIENQSHGSGYVIFTHQSVADGVSDMSCHEFNDEGFICCNEISEEAYMETNNSRGASIRRKRTASKMNYMCRSPTSSMFPPRKNKQREDADSKKLRKQLMGVNKERRRRESIVNGSKKTDNSFQLQLRNPEIFKAGTYRNNLFYDVCMRDELAEPEDHMASFIQKCLTVDTKFSTSSTSNLTKNENSGRSQNTKTFIGSAIVYCRSRNECEEVAETLLSAGIAASAYHAGLPKKKRNDVQKQWTSNQIPVVAATVAFGMGLDKADVRCVIHWSPSQNLAGYYQEAGRAGRDGKRSYCRIYYSKQDQNEWNCNCLVSGELAKLKEKAKKTTPDGEKAAMQVKSIQTGLQKMLEYCESAKCRHVSIASFFDDTDCRPCKTNCDYCRDPTKTTRNAEAFVNSTMNEKKKEEAKRDDEDQTKATSPDDSIESEPKIVDKDDWQTINEVLAVCVDENAAYYCKKCRREQPVSKIIEHMVFHLHHEQVITPSFESRQASILEEYRSPSKDDVNDEYNDIDCDFELKIIDSNESTTNPPEVDMAVNELLSDSHSDESTNHEPESDSSDDSDVVEEVDSIVSRESLQQLAMGRSGLQLKNRSIGIIQRFLKQVGSRITKELPLLLKGSKRKNVSHRDMMFALRLMFGGPNRKDYFKSLMK